MTMEPPFADSYWAIPGELGAGEYPGDLSDRAARAKLIALLDAGVRLFVDLTEAFELEPYGPMLAELAAARGVEARHVRHPIRDAGIPRSTVEMAAILDLLDEARAMGVPAYVHCWGGTGRTGTVVGCHFRRRGLSGEEALARVLGGWRTMAKAPSREAAGMTSPETERQREYVRGWTEAAPGAGAGASQATPGGAPGSIVGGWRHVTPDLLALIRSQYRLDWHGFHGIGHWERVLVNGRLLAERTGADVVVVEFFAALHDSRRLNDDHDPEHGARAAALVRTVDRALVPLTAAQLDVLAEACRTHTDGTTTADPTIGTCWDADRLDLLRVGIRPDPRYLATEAARDPAVIRGAMARTRAGR